MKFSAMVFLGLVSVQAIQINDYVATKWNKKNPHPGYPASQDGFDGGESLGKYSREIPTTFGGPGSGDDQFMYSMFDKYAREEATVDGKKTG